LKALEIFGIKRAVIHQPAFCAFLTEALKTRRYKTTMQDGSRKKKAERGDLLVSNCPLRSKIQSLHLGQGLSSQLNASDIGRLQDRYRLKIPQRLLLLQLLTFSELCGFCFLGH
jgi:hypothetical protein